MSVINIPVRNYCPSRFTEAHNIMRKTYAYAVLKIQKWQPNVTPKVTLFPVCIHLFIHTAIVAVIRFVRNIET